MVSVSTRLLQTIACFFWPISYYSLIFQTDQQRKKIKSIPYEMKPWRPKRWPGTGRPVKCWKYKNLSFSGQQHGCNLIAGAARSVCYILLSHQRGMSHFTQKTQAADLIAVPVSACIDLNARTFPSSGTNPKQTLSCLFALSWSTIIDRTMTYTMRFQWFGITVRSDDLVQLQM